jgi:DNA repair exonuclease SbcCD ATPase subunit
MIKFEKITVRNFASYGNTPTTYTFKNGITSIIGKNGFGKSYLILDSVFYALFGVCYRPDTKLKSFVNDINDANMEVILHFSKNNDHYYVRRTMKMKSEADFFGIYKLLPDNSWELVPQRPHKKDYQKQFEEDILGMSKDYFELIVFKSKLKPVDFVSLSKPKRMEFMDALFNTKLFDTMAEINKETLADIKIKDQLENNNFKLLKENLNTQKALIEASNKKTNDIFIERISELKKEIETNKTEIEKFTKALVVIKTYKTKADSLSTEINTETKKVRDADKKIIELRSYIRASGDKLKVFESYCSGCDKLEEIKKIEKIKDYEDEIKLLETQKIEFDKIVEEKNKELNSIKEITIKERIITESISKLENQNKINNNKIVELEKEINKEPVSIELNSIEEKIKESENKLFLIRRDQKYEEVIKKLINPLKFYVVKKWIPYFNQRLNEYLFKFNIPINIIFDEKFDETIILKNKKNRDFGNFSEGQKARMNFAMMFSIIDLTKKITNQSFNLLVLDEVLYTIDTEGKDLLLDILKEMTDTEIIFVGHGISIDENKLDRKIEIINENGFSKVVEF